MSSEPVWEFPVDGGDQWRGFNDAGIEHFRGSPFASLAREILQNSLDAAAGRPVTVSFKYRDVAIQDIPNIEQLRASFKQCLSMANAEGKKAKDFFLAAEKLLKSKTVPVLSIIEHNTTGMRGPCRNGTPYFAYVKASGQSKKDDDSETGLGSYGIGKFAPFAVSELRTIFVSTVFREGTAYKQYTQGKALLMSHKDEAKMTRQNVGYWGVKENCMPVEGVNPKLPGWLQRTRKETDLENSLGTTLNILGFHTGTEWKSLLIASVLENFFGAIWKGRLIVEVEATALSKETMSELFDKKHIRDALEGSKGQPEGFDNAKSYFRTLAATEDVFIEDQENRELGNCEMRIVLGDELPKRVAILRNGMLITDQMDKLKRFGDFKEFAAVIECHSRKGNELLRDMEPPRHNDFDPDRLSLEDKPRGQRAIIELGKWAREMLKRHARDPVSDVSDVKELADYFPDDSDQAGGEKGEEVNPVGKIEIRAQPFKRKPAVILAEVEGVEGGAARQGKGGGGGGGGAGSGSGKGQSGSGKKSSKILPLNNVRSIVLTDRRRRVSATPEFSGNMELVVYEAGADTDRELKVVKSSNGKIRNGVVSNLKGKRGNRLTLEIELDAPFHGAMKMVANAI
jgi:hypothetical protein